MKIIGGPPVGIVVVGFARTARSRGAKVFRRRLFRSHRQSRLCECRCEKVSKGSPLCAYFSLTKYSFGINCLRFTQRRSRPQAPHFSPTPCSIPRPFCKLAKSPATARTEELLDVLHPAASVLRRRGRGKIVGVVVPDSHRDG